MWLASTKGLHQAFSNFQFNSGNYKIERDNISFTVKITGTQDGDLILLGMPPITATGKSVTLPEEGGIATIENGKIIAMKMDVSEKGGLLGILKQIGIQPPH